MLSGLRRAAMPLLFYSGGLLICGALVSVTFGIFRGSFDLTLVPRGDNAFALSYIKAYIKDPDSRFDNALGYPGVQDNALHPSFEFSYRLFLWLVTRWIKDPLAAYALMYVAGTAALFIATAAALQHLRIRLGLAILGALVFVVCPYFNSRAFGHDFLALYFSVPLGAVLALRTTDVLDRSGIGRTLREPFVAIAIVVCATWASIIASSPACSSRSRPLFSPLPSELVTAAVRAVCFTSADRIDGRQRHRDQRHRRCLAGSMIGSGASHRADHVRPADGRRRRRDRLDTGPRPLHRSISLVGHPTGEGMFEFPGLMLTAIILASPLLLAALGASQPAADEESRRRQTITFMAAACIVFGVFYAFLAASAMSSASLFLPPFARPSGSFHS